MEKKLIGMAMNGFRFTNSEVKETEDWMAFVSQNQARPEITSIVTQTCTSHRTVPSTLKPSPKRTDIIFTTSNSKIKTEKLVSKEIKVEENTWKGKRKVTMIKIRYII